MPRATSVQGYGSAVPFVGDADFVDLAIDYVLQRIVQRCYWLMINVVYRQFSR